MALHRLVFKVKLSSYMHRCKQKVLSVPSSLCSVALWYFLKKQWLFTTQGFQHFHNHIGAGAAAGTLGTLGLHDNKGTTSDEVLNLIKLLLQIVSI